MIMGVWQIWFQGQGIVIAVFKSYRFWSQLSLSVGIFVHMAAV
jgi:hypothetical protein